MTAQEETGDVASLVETPDEVLINRIAHELGIWPGSTEAEFVAAVRRSDQAASFGGEQ